MLRERFRRIAEVTLYFRNLSQHVVQVDNSVSKAVEQSIAQALEVALIVMWLS